MAGSSKRQYDPDEVLVRTFAKLSPVAFGISCGLFIAAGIFGATAILILRGGGHVGPHLGLLSQYFPGYDVNWRGGLLGFAYGFLAGFAGGWLVAFMRNVSIAAYLYTVRLWINLSREHFLDRFDN